MTSNDALERWWQTRSDEDRAKLIDLRKGAALPDDLDDLPPVSDTPPADGPWGWMWSEAPEPTMVYRVEDGLARFLAAKRPD